MLSHSVVAPGWTRFPAGLIDAFILFWLTRHNESCLSPLGGKSAQIKTYFHLKTQFQKRLGPDVKESSAYTNCNF